MLDGRLGEVEAGLALSSAVLVGRVVVVLVVVVVAVVVVVVVVVVVLVVLVVIIVGAYIAREGRCDNHLG